MILLDGKQMAQPDCLLYQQLFYVADDQEASIIGYEIKGEWLKSLKPLGKLDPELLPLQIAAARSAHVGSSCVYGSEVQCRGHGCPPTAHSNVEALTLTWPYLEVIMIKWAPKSEGQGLVVFKEETDVFREDIVRVWWGHSETEATRMPGWGPHQDPNL